jgi:hypothetical protein
MTERKPPGVSFENWVDQQIRESMDKGGFENLPGAGKPIKDLETPYDELWVKRKLKAEGVPTDELLPTPLKLRKEIEELPARVAKLHGERSVRELVKDLNERIHDWIRLPLGGPPVHVTPIDVEEVVARWRQDRAARAAATTETAALASKPPRRRWWHRFKPSGVRGPR